MTTDDLDEDPITPARFDALVAFLLARLDEDEAAARTVLLDREFLPFESVVQAADHGTRHGPLRVLREVAAKRAVVQKYRVGRHAQLDGFPVGGLDVAAALIAALASVFVEHPDFDSEWLAVIEGRAERTDDSVPLPRQG
jgi:hypothetical protein